MSNLIDRYVWAVSTNLPQGMRDDVARELRATITDMTDDRAGTATDPTREALEELGDPVLLARGYDGATRHLIGPPFYDIYVRLLRTLSAVVLPLVLVASLVVELWDRTSRCCRASWAPSATRPRPCCISSSGAR